MVLAEAGAGRGGNLELARNKLAEDVRVFIINVINFFLASDTEHLITPKLLIYYEIYELG